MGERMGGMLLMAGAVALVAGLSAAPSLAATATTWKVSPGGSITLAKSGHFTLGDVTTGHSLVCARTAGAGRFKSGSGLPGARIGSVTALSLSDCTGPRGLTFTMTLSHLPWTLNADTYNPAITAGLTTGTISGIHATMSGTNCHATVDGTSATADNGRTQIHYHNSLAKLKIRTQDSNLHFYNVSGCGGLIKSGDAITFSSAYLVSPKQTITGS
jgi:hypothetical protein